MVERGELNCVAARFKKMKEGKISPCLLFTGCQLVELKELFLTACTPFVLESIPPF